MLRRDYLPFQAVLAFAKDVRATYRRASTESLDKLGRNLDKKDGN